MRICRGMLRLLFVSRPGSPLQLLRRSMVGNLAAWLLDGALANGAGPRTALREGDRAWTFDELARPRRASCRLRCAACGSQRGERVLDPDARHARGRGGDPRHDPRRRGRGAGVRARRRPTTSRTYVLHAGAVDRDRRRHARARRSTRSATRRPICARSICVGAKLAGSHDFHKLVEARSRSRPAPSGDDDVVAAPLLGGLGPRRAARGPALPAHDHGGARRRSRASCSSSPTRIASCASRGSRRRTASARACSCRSRRRPSRCCSRRSRSPSSCSRRSISTSRPCCSRRRRSTRSSRTMPRRRQVDKPLATLRHAVAGAEGMPERLIPRIRSVLGTEVVVGYGLTEIFQFALAGRSNDPGARPGVCGKPLAGVQVRLVDEDGDPVGVDEIGTLELQCGSLFTGYWGGGGASRQPRDARRRLVHDARSLHGRSRGLLSSLRPRRRSVQGRRQVGVARPRSSAR